MGLAQPRYRNAETHHVTVPGPQVRTEYKAYIFSLE